jgi:hypothetical protein
MQLGDDASAGNDDKGGELTILDLIQVGDSPVHRKRSCMYAPLSMLPARNLALEYYSSGIYHVTSSIIQPEVFISFHGGFPKDPNDEEEVTASMAQAKEIADMIKVQADILCWVCLKPYVPCRCA